MILGHFGGTARAHNGGFGALLCLVILGGLGGQSHGGMSALKAPSLKVS